ncbi:MAG: lipid-A-disaccharide synthase [Cytophagales bacterium]|nr:lipid-A-disaccharide synthase [Cytophagales bacterium]
MKYYIIAGEKSGDMHGANLMVEIKNADAQSEFRYFGGDLMKAQGGDLVQHYKTMSYMGFLEVINNIDKIYQTLERCKKDIVNHRPDVLILIDYSGFNLRIAKFAKRHGIKVYYYISPKIWAWNRSRVHYIKKYVDRMFVILPFEKDFYKKYNIEVDYVGNPILDAIHKHHVNTNFRFDNQLDMRPIIAVLPGSRPQEIEYMLHFMVSIIPAFPDFQFVVAAVNNIDKYHYEAYRRNDKVYIIYDQTYDILSQSQVAIVTSGTATLETALFNVPQVVCYNTSAITYIIGRLLIKVKYISLVNLIADRSVVKELIQDEFSPANIILEIKKILQNSDYKNSMLKGYDEVIDKIGKIGASHTAAQLMVKYLGS